MVKADNNHTVALQDPLNMSKYAPNCYESSLTEAIPQYKECISTLKWWSFSTTVICLIFFYMKDLCLCSLKMIDCLSKVRSCFNMERSSFIRAYFYYAAKLTLVIDRQVKFSMKVLCTKTILHIDLFHFHFKIADINSNKMEVAFVNCFQFYRQSGLVPSKFKHL